MTSLESAIRDISPDFVPDRRDALFMAELVKHEATPEAVRYFARNCRRITNYGYWFALGTIWVSYSGWSNLDLWKTFFRSPRPNRDSSLMKPSELRAWRSLPDVLTAYRAHRPNESDWISYTLNPFTAGEFAARRGVDHVAEYRIKKSDTLCLFLRRGETEVLMLDREMAQQSGTLPVRFRGAEVEIAAPPFASPQQLS